MEAIATLRHELLEAIHGLNEENRLLTPAKVLKESVHAFGVLSALLGALVSQQQREEQNRLLFDVQEEILAFQLRPKLYDAARLGRITGETRTWRGLFTDTFVRVEQLIKRARDLEEALLAEHLAESGIRDCLRQAEQITSLLGEGVETVDWETLYEGLKLTQSAEAGQTNALASDRVASVNEKTEELLAELSGLKPAEYGAVGWAPDGSGEKESLTGGEEEVQQDIGRITYTRESLAESTEEVAKAMEEAAGSTQRWQLQRLFSAVQGLQQELSVRLDSQIKRYDNDRVKQELAELNQQRRISKSLLSTALGEGKKWEELIQKREKIEEVNQRALAQAQPKALLPAKLKEDAPPETVITFLKRVSIMEKSIQDQDRLQDHLVASIEDGDLRRKIAHLPFKEGLRKIKETVADPQLLKMSLLGEVSTLQPATSIKREQQNVNQILSTINSLRSLGIPFFDGEFTRKISCLLTEGSRKELARKWAAEGTSEEAKPESLEAYLRELERIYDAMCYEQRLNDLSKVRKGGSPEKILSNQTSVQGSSERRTDGTVKRECQLCENKLEAKRHGRNHTIRQCPLIRHPAKFTESSLRRLEAVRACLTCLEIPRGNLEDHAKDCGPKEITIKVRGQEKSFPTTCPTCKAPQPFQALNGLVCLCARKKAKKYRDEKGITSNRITLRPPLRTEGETINGQRPGKVLLHVDKLRIMTKEGPKLVTAMYDDGATNTTIFESQSRTLDLEGRRWDGTVCTITGSSKSGGTIVSIPILAHNGDTVNIEAVSVKGDGQPQGRPSVSIPREWQEHFAGEKTEPEDCLVALILGSDLTSLRPVEVARHGNLSLSRSLLTGRMILRGTDTKGAFQSTLPSHHLSLKETEQETARPLPAQATEETPPGEKEGAGEAVREPPPAEEGGTSPDTAVKGRNPEQVESYGEVQVTFPSEEGDPGDLDVGDPTEEYNGSGLEEEEILLNRVLIKESPVPFLSVLDNEEDKNFMRSFGVEAALTSPLNHRCQQCSDCTRCGHAFRKGEDSLLKPDAAMSKEIEERMQNDIEYDPKEKRWHFRYYFTKEADDIDEAESRQQSLIRFKQLEKKANLEGNEELKRELNEIFREKREKGAVKLHEELEEEHEDFKHMKKAFVSSNFHCNENSSSSKTRIVWDLSARTSSSPSINAATLVPASVSPIANYLLDLRGSESLAATDISRAFEAVAVDLESSSKTSFPWREGLGGEESGVPIKFYSWTTFLFGSSGAPGGWFGTLKKAVDHFVTAREDAAEIKRCTYVDDNLAKNMRLLKLFLMVCRESSFLVKGATVVGPEFPPGSVEKLGLEVKREGESRLLGMSWELDTDTWAPGLALNLSAKRRGIRLSPHMTTHEEVEEQFSRFKLTKRSLTSLMGQCWDPLGLWTPVTLKWKLLLREVIATHPSMRWDSELDASSKARARSLAKELITLRGKSSFPRSVVAPGGTEATYELTVYSDGGETASGYCGYLSWTSEDGQRGSNLLAAGSRLTPVRVGTSIPKNELAALAYAARLMVWIKETLPLTVSTASLVSDSVVSLKQAMSNPHLYNSPHALYIAEIQAARKSLGVPVDLYYCEGLENGADACSKLHTGAADIVLSEEWRKGFKLDRPREERGWTRMQEVQAEVLPGMRKRYHRFVSEGIVQSNAVNIGRAGPSLSQRPQGRLRSQPVEEEQTFIASILDKNGSFQRTIRVVSYLLQWRYRDMPLHDLERLAKTRILQDHRPQAEEGTRTYRVNRGNLIERDGVLLAQRRLVRGNPDFKEFTPWVHPQSRLAAAILSDYHSKDGHGVDIKRVCFNVSKEFMIPNAFRVLSRLSDQCTACIKRTRRAVSVVLGPGSGTLGSPPLKRFSRASIDPCGPFWVTELRRRRKLYLFASICLATGVLHATVTADLTTASFLAALGSIQANHGQVKEIRLDNATAHTATEKRVDREEEQNGGKVARGTEEEEEALTDIDGDTLKETKLKYRTAGVDFRFTSPRSPHENPSECAVKILKSTLRRMNLDAFNLSTLEFVHFVEKAVYIANNSSIDPSPAVSRSSLLTKNSVRFNTFENKESFAEEDHAGLAAEAKLSVKLLKAYHDERDLAIFKHLRDIKKWHDREDNEDVEASDIVLINDKSSRSIGGIGEVLEAYKDKTNGRVYQVKVGYLPPQKNNILGRWRRQECLRNVRSITVLIKHHQRRAGKILSLAELCFQIAHGEDRPASSGGTQEEPRSRKEETGSEPHQAAQDTPEAGPRDVVPREPVRVTVATQPPEMMDLTGRRRPQAQGARLGPARSRPGDAPSTQN